MYVCYIIPFYQHNDNKILKGTHPPRLRAFLLASINIKQEHPYTLIILPIQNIFNPYIIKHHSYYSICKPYK